MSQKCSTLLCWHAERAGIEVLEKAVLALRNRHIDIGHVLYLVQSGRDRDIPRSVANATVEIIDVSLEDPTHHKTIYEQVQALVLPRLGEFGDALHINVSPGTPAMHSVWLILHAGGALPNGTKLWSSQFSRATNRTRIDPVNFPITTYLAEIHRYTQIQPDLAVYEPESRSPARHKAFDGLSRYARVTGAPLLILGERGTGKTRLVETFVATLKARKKVVTVPCGGLDSALSESLLFGHRKGAFTGAASDRSGLLAEANGGILFLDEVQDLPKPVQRKFVRVFQDRHHRYRPLGSDREEVADVELVCASNLPVIELRERLDADLFDRLSHLSITIPPLRECREDLASDWSRVWRELRQRDDLPREAPWSSEMERVLIRHALPGNLRDLQRLAVLTMAWWTEGDAKCGIRSALGEWEPWSVPPIESKGNLGEGTRTERIRWFRQQLAKWSKEHHGTWAAAAAVLGCDEKTLRQDSSVLDSEYVEK